MAFLKKYFSIKATSLLESVVALSIIAICLYFAIMIFSMVFTPRTSVQFYDTQNKVNELFYLAELKGDSLSNAADEHLVIEEHILNTALKEFKVGYKKGEGMEFEKNFYIHTDE